MITIHHLGVSQSDRIVWLMEELGPPVRAEVVRPRATAWRRPRTWRCTRRRPRR